MFSVGGDVFMEFAAYGRGEVYFLLGLGGRQPQPARCAGLHSPPLLLCGAGTFLVAHVFYIVAFVREYSGAAVFSAVPLYSFAVVTTLYLKPGVPDDMLIPVAVYAIVGAGGGLVALRR